MPVSSAFLVLVVWLVGQSLKFLFKMKNSMKPRFIYVLFPFLNFNFISKLNWKSACNVQMTELEGKTKYDGHTHIVGRLE